MERKFYTDKFEQLLKEKSDEFRMYPSKRVWHSIYNDLHPGRKWPSVAMSLLLLFALLFIGYLNTNNGTSSSSQTFADVIQKNNYTAHANRAGFLSFINDYELQSENNTASNSLSNTSNTSAVQTANNSLPDLNQVDNNAAVNATNLNGNTSLASARPIDNNDGLNTVLAVDNYIRSNRLLSDVAALGNKKKNRASTTQEEYDVVSESPAQQNNISAARLQKPVSPVTQNNNSVPVVINTDNKNQLPVTETPLQKLIGTAANKTISAEEKAWMEDYALHNKSGRKKWKDHMAMEIYATPSIGYRTLNSNTKNDANTTALLASASSTAPTRPISQKPGLGLEAGVGLSYSFAKNLRIKAGVQLNYTSYGINADETNHPILTTLLLNDIESGHTFLSTRSSTLTNSTGLQPVTVHNSTYQVSVPVGFAVKLAGNKKMEWFAGASLQPSFVFGGTTHFISSDNNNYVSDQSLLRKWNLNSGIETYLNYKVGGYTLQVGPQMRYQMFSTYSKKYTVNEKLYNMGLKIGIVKGF